MDWFDPQYAAATEEISEGAETLKRKGKRTESKQNRSRASGKSLRKQVSAALAQPIEVWSVAYDHALSRLDWPDRCSIEGTFLWSAIIQEQAEVLVRAGMSAKKLAAIVSEKPGNTPQERTEQISDVVGLMDQSLEEIAFQWLDQSDAQPGCALAVAALAWHLPEQAGRPANAWLTQWLHALLDRLENYEPDAEASVLCQLLWRCELPLLLGLACAASRRSWMSEASRAMDNLAELLESAEDSVDPWLLYGATYLRAALASVVRCRVMADALGLRKWYPAQQKALAELLKHAARWCRPDGTQLLAAGRKPPKADAMWQALSAQTKRPKPLLAAMTLSGIGSGKRRQARQQVHVSRLPALTHYSEHAAGACLQSDWRHKGSRIAVDFSDADICIEALGPKGLPVLAGQWTAHVEIDGQAQLQLEPWREVCWFSDDDVDYLELEARFGQRAKVQRQAILLRQERLLYLADGLLADTQSKLCLQSRLPLAGDATFSPAEKSTEGFIHVSGKRRVLALPLFLPEWRRQLSLSAASGSFSCVGEDLVAKYETSGRRIYIPCIISLCTSHAHLPFTWRHLTVGDDLRIVSPDEARAFRVQIGTDQWFIYCNLSQAIRRTALGVHTMADFYAARFDGEDGEMETLVEVEPAESDATDQ